MEEEIDFYEKIKNFRNNKDRKVQSRLIDDSFFKYYNEINKRSNSQSVVLDIGTRDGEKIMSNINEVGMIIGIDFSKDKIEKANENVEKYKKLAKFLVMDINKLEFPQNFFDIICVNHNIFNGKEAKRVLKPKGVFIAEDLDEEDCLELKAIFRRGQGYFYKEKNYERSLKELKNAEFTDIEYFQTEQEFYLKTEDDLIMFLIETRIIQEFGSRKGDFEKFKKFVKEYSTDKGIVLKRRYYGIIALK
ncbi:hypothetical protein D3C72_1243390 [compost metagenome]